MPNEENPQGFVRTKLPWIAAAGALVLFLITLNHWVNLRSLPITARITGWEWTLPTQNPALFTITYPLRFLPMAIQPIALNIFSAVCAALTLALLARSVALLPHDRTHEQRTRERSEFSLLTINLAWVPPLLAVLVCGLQLTFWEHATALTGESLDLLLFAYVIRCLLEYRISREESWLYKMAFVYGLGVTNNWAFIGFFPLFLGAVIWIKGVRFFDPGFLGKATLFGLAGLLLYLVLPAVWMVKSPDNFSFWQVLKANLVQQKLYLVEFKPLRNRALLLGLVSVLPVILMGIRWPSSFGDTSAAGSALTNLAFRVIHLFFLGACLFVAFDPGYSPRKLGMGLSFLTFYYLAAIAIGYYSGYALLVFREAARKGWKRDDSAGKLFNPIVQFAVLAVLVGVPAALAWKNFPVVQASNGAILREYANHTIKSLPQKPAYLLSEDVFQLSLVEAGLQSGGAKNDYVFVNTRALETPSYHVQMRKRYGERWPELFDPEVPPLSVGQLDIQQMARALASSNLVVYLHPSFGYFFDALYPVPNGPTYTMVPFPDDQVLPPEVTPEQLQVNRSSWTEPAETLKRLEAMSKYDSPDAQYLLQKYSRGVNAWGVTLQRANQFPEAGRQFNQSAQLSTNNAAARLNREFNASLQAGQPLKQLDFSKPEELLGNYRTWDAMLAENGPLDRPDFCLYLGGTFLNSSQYRQAAYQFSRVTAFQPTNYAARIAFAKALVFGGWPANGLAEVEKIRVDLPGMAQVNLAEVAAVRAAGLYGQTNLAEAENTLREALRTNPGNPMLSDSLLELYRTSGQITNALALLANEIQQNPTNLTARLRKAELHLGQQDYVQTHAALDGVLSMVPNNPSAQLFHAFAYIQEKKYDDALARIERVLQGNPENVQALVYKGVVQMELKQYDKAREAYTSALRKQPGEISILRNRAILNLRAERWEDAREDYETLRQATPRSHAVYYGLGEVAFAEKDYDAAKKFYETYLKFAPAGGPAELEDERKKVEARLQQINTGKK